VVQTDLMYTRFDFFLSLRNDCICLDYVGLSRLNYPLIGIGGSEILSEAALSSG